MTRRGNLFTLAGATLSLGLLATLTGCGGGGSNGGSSSGGGNGGGTQTSTGTGTGGVATINLAGTTWKTTSVSSGSASSTCPGEADSNPSSSSNDVVTICGSDDLWTFNANRTLTFVGLGFDNAIHTITGTWSQNGNTLTFTVTSETPPDTAGPAVPYTESDTITAINSNEYTLNYNDMLGVNNGTPVSYTLTKQ